MNLKFWTWFKKPRKNVVVTMTSTRMEFFHLSYEDSSQSLCGKPTLPSPLPLSQWEVYRHPYTRWCARCNLLRRDL